MSRPLRLGPAGTNLWEVAVLRIDDRAGLTPCALATLTDVVSGHNTLQAATRWALGCGYELLDVIDQDEFTRDVIFEMNPAHFLVYDVT